MPDEPDASERRSRLVAAVVVAVVVLGALGGLLGWKLQGGKRQAAVPPPPPAVRTAPASGVYIAPGDPVQTVEFGHWRKVPVDFAADYLPSTTWQDISSPLWLFRDWQGSGYPLMLGVPMLPDSGQASVADGAKGNYDSYFRTLAKNLVRFGAANAALRIGWEMNGAWYRWSAVGDPPAWIDFYRHIVKAMRSVSGAHFTFIWNPNTGTRSMDAEAAYPGDAYVDQIGMDLYDWEWNTPDATPQSRWTWIETHTNGLDWLASFAAAHHKPISLPEWGLALPQDNTNGGGGDDPYFVSHLLEWMATHNVASEAYFDNSTHRLRNFPNAAREYIRTERSLARLPANPGSKHLRTVQRSAAAGTGGSSGTHPGHRLGSA
ncbi:MAG: glycoside hydrolase family 26 protein [Mycobacteriales bacterium]